MWAFGGAGLQLQAWDPFHGRTHPLQDDEPEWVFC